MAAAPSIPGSPGTVAAGGQVVGLRDPQGVGVEGEFCGVWDPGVRAGGLGPRWVSSCGALSPERIPEKSCGMCSPRKKGAMMRRCKQRTELRGGGQQGGQGSSAGQQWGIWTSRAGFRDVPKAGLTRFAEGLGRRGGSPGDWRGGCRHPRQGLVRGPSLWAGGRWG